MTANEKIEQGSNKSNSGAGEEKKKLNMKVKDS